MDRRKFIRNTSLAATATYLSGTNSYGKAELENKLPRWKGFNLTDFNTPNPLPGRSNTTEDHLKWMSDWGFNFDRSTKITSYGHKLEKKLLELIQKQ